MSELMLVGVDPGKITGLAVWTERVDGLTSPIVTAEVPAADVIHNIKLMTNGQRPTLIGCERMTSAGNGGRPMSAQPDADVVTGAVRSLAGELLVRCVYQSAGPAKRLGTTRVLKKLGYYAQTPDGHANDAVRQVLLLLATFHVERFVKLLDDAGV